MIRAPRLLRAAQNLRRIGNAASSLVSMAWLPTLAAAKPIGAAWRVTEVTDFGSNPGRLRMLAYAPERSLPAGAPLIVVMHGCQQDAVGFATDAGWLDLAKRLRIPLVLPEQTAENNRGRCFNWFRPDDVGRDRGEAMSVRQMVRTAAKRFGSDRRRVFIVGLSAGGAMATAMLAAYPAVFAAGAVVAGMPVGAASTSSMALLRMRRASPFSSRAGLVAAVRAAAPAGGGKAWPRLSIWQGGRDRTIDPANAEALAAQWSALHGFDSIPASDTEPATGVRRRAWGRAGHPAVEFWTLASMGHGFPVDPATAGGGRSGPWMVDAGVAAAQRIAAFWGIDRTPS